MIILGAKVYPQCSLSSHKAPYHILLPPPEKTRYENGPYNDEKSNFLHVCVDVVYCTLTSHFITYTLPVKRGTLFFPSRSVLLPQICQLWIHDADLLFNSVPKKRSTDWRGHLSPVVSLSCSQKQFEEILIFLTWHSDLQEYVSRKDRHGQIQYSDWLWCLNEAQLVLRGLKCAEKMSVTPSHQQPWPLIPGRMDPCFHGAEAKFGPSYSNVTAELETDLTGNVFNFWWACVKCSLSLQKLLRSSGAATALLPVSTFCFM